MSSQRPALGTGLLCAIFFLSGAAGLLFESLWFRQAGLAFGNGVWASSLVLSSFMAGLALGNVLAARWRRLGARPIAAYAALELTIAASGVGLVLLLPQLGPLLAPFLGPLLEQPALLNALRLGLAFTLLVVPATAMGATLPLLVQALEARTGSFGAALGRLYGWNTLGAMLGAVAGEAFLVAPLGVRGTALVAAGCNLVAGAGALAIGRSIAGAREQTREEPPRGAVRDGRVRLALAAAFLAGLALLALEVVWFRFLHLFVRSSSLAFSLLLATVLAGIGAGGLVGGAWLRRDAHAWRHASWLSCGAGALVAALYLGFAWIPALFAGRYLGEPVEILALAALLVLPVSLVSGALFPLFGAALGEVLRPARRAAGLLTFANTIGAGLGSLLGGFVLLPWLGMERSFFLLAALYLVVALLAERLARASAGAPLPRARWAAVGALALALLAFPFGLMESYFLRIPVRRATADQTLVAVREGRTETSQMLRRDFLGEPVSHQLLTDGYSMAGTAIGGRRYMKLYVWMPVALRPDPKQALLISFGVGSTARALTDTRSLERIDVVDISREILALSDLVYPPEQHPLRDPRVHVHVEDGRWFLQTTDRRYDLITGEPPPPKHAGVVNLYTREYFELVRSRLAPGGIHSYWLPVHELSELDARSITRAYCDVFPDCSLWTGTSLDWMLVGTNDAHFTRNEAAFTAQWRDPAVRPELEAVGLERPEQLGATFLADADQLRAWIADAPAVTDDFPKRIATSYPEDTTDRDSFFRFMDTGAAAERFAASGFVRESWPPVLRERTLDWFRTQAIVNRLMANSPPPVPARQRIAEFDALLTDTDLRTLPLWTLGLTREQIEILERRLSAGLENETDHQAGLAARDLAARRYDVAARRYGALLRRNPHDRQALTWRLYALARAGDLEEARAELRRAGPWLVRDGGDRGDLDWIRERFGLDDGGADGSP
jgi:predicted membrane-bound spermidine synthase